MRRGITEKSVTVLNSLPPIDDATVLERAGLADVAEAGKLTPLHIDWQYSGGLEREFIRLLPGESQILRESDAQAIMRECAERGLVTHPVGASEDVVLKARVEGMKRAITFYADRGLKRVQALRKKHGLTKEEVEENKYDYWSFYYNQAVADLLREHLNEIAPNAAKRRKTAA